MTELVFKALLIAISIVGIASPICDSEIYIQNWELDHAATLCKGKNNQIESIKISFEENYVICTNGKIYGMDIEIKHFQERK